MTIVTRSDKGSALTHAEMDNNLVELDTIPTGKVFPSDKTIGIKLDVDTPDWGWHDLVSTLKSANDASSPTSTVYRGGIKAWQFDEQNELFIDFHLPHDYVSGTTLFIHSHWSHNSTHVTGGSVTWAFEMMYAKRRDETPFPVPITASVVSPINIVQYSHLVHETSCSVAGGSGVAIDTNELEVDGVIQCRVYLDSNDITTDDASIVDPFLHFVDLHYNSTGIPTKEKGMNPTYWG